MFKLWIDRNGTVQTLTRGSLASQHKDLVKVLKHLQERVSESERIVSEASASYVDAMTKLGAKHADGVRREAADMGILQKRKENQNG